MAEHWRIELRIETLTSFRTLGAGQTLPLVDRMLQVDTSGKPMIPGSQVRGRVRAHLERLLKAVGRPVCAPPRPENICPHDAHIQARLAQLDEPYCLACRIFGSPWREAAVAFGNFYLDEESLDQPEPIAERTSVGLSRRLATAKPGRLFQSQTTTPGMRLSFSGTAGGWMEPHELGWLLMAANLVTHLGGDKARGLGRIQITVADLRRWDSSSGTWTSGDAKRLTREAFDHAAL